MITLLGRNFGPDPLSSTASPNATFVLVNGRECQVPTDGQTVINDTYIRCMPQPDVLSNSLVRVWVSGQQSGAVSYAFDPAVVQSVTPPNGPTAGGSAVVVRGINFGPASVLFTMRIGLNEGNCTHVNDTHAFCTTPAGGDLEINPVRLIGQGFSWIQNTPPSFRYDAPNISAVAPSGKPLLLRFAE